MKYNIPKYQNGNKIAYIEKPKSHTPPIHKKQIDDNFDTIVNIYRDLRKSGLNDEQTTGLLGNIVVETGGSFDPNQTQYGKGPGIGLIQQEVKTKRYNRYLDHTTDPSNLGEQIKYIKTNFFEDSRDNSKTVWGRFGNQDKWWSSEHTSPEDSAKLTSELYLRPGKPNLKQRQLASRYIYDKLDVHKKVAPLYSSPWTSFSPPPKYLGMKGKKWIDIKSYKNVKPIRELPELKQQGGTINYNINNILSIWKK